MKIKDLKNILKKYNRNTKIFILEKSQTTLLLQIDKVTYNLLNKSAYILTENGIETIKTPRLEASSRGFRKIKT